MKTWGKDSRTETSKKKKASQQHKIIIKNLKTAKGDKEGHYMMIKKSI